MVRAGIWDKHTTTERRAFIVSARDNRVVYIAKAFTHQDEFFTAIAKVANTFSPQQVINVTPTLGDDWNGEPSVFLQVVLADNAVPRPQLLAFTKEISRAIVRQVRP